MKVLVVDDEIRSLHSFLDQVVDKIDVDFHFLRDDENAILTYCKNNEIQGAFLDINMPGINGIDLAKKIVQINPKTKIVFITGLNVSMANIPEPVRSSVLGITYKPIDVTSVEHYLALIKNVTPKLSVYMFGNFDCFISNRVVVFPSNKSKELFALLLIKNGKSLSMEQAISYLWPDKDVNKAKILYRDAVWRLRSLLKSISFECIDFQRALLVLDKTDIECDYYDFLNGKKSLYKEQFMEEYEWAKTFKEENKKIMEKKPF